MRGKSTHALHLDIQPGEELLQSMLRVLGMRIRRSRSIVEPVEHNRGSRAAKRGFHEANGGGDAARRASDDGRRIALPDEFGLDGHQAVAPLLAVELAGFLFVRLPAAQHATQKLKRKLLAAGCAAAVELADAREVHAFRMRLADKGGDLPGDGEGARRRNACENGLVREPCAVQRLRCMQYQRRELNPPLKLAERRRNGERVFQKIERHR